MFLPYVLEVNAYARIYWILKLVLIQKKICTYLKVTIFEYFKNRDNWT